MNGFTQNMNNLPPGVSELDEHINPQEPDICDDDYTLSDCGPLGGRTYVSQLNQSFGSMDDAITAILQDMERQQFWPNVWYVNDHGNIDLLAINDDGSYSIVDSWV